MSTLNPRIVQGAKGPSDLSMLRSADEIETFVGARKEGEVVFRSRFRNFRLCIKPEIRRMLNDEIFSEPAKFVVFNNYEFRTTDEFEIEQIRVSKRFGLSLDYWDQGEAVQIAEEARYQDFVKMLDDNPKMKQRLFVDAGLKDFRVTQPIGPSSKQ